MAEEVPIIEEALFEFGRPVIVVPYIQTQGANFNRVMVGWDEKSSRRSRYRGRDANA